MAVRFSTAVKFGICWDEGVAELKKRLEKALLFVIALSMLLTMLPVAALGEAQPASAKGVEAKKPDQDIAYYLLRKDDVEMLQLPPGTKPVQKIIPRPCVNVRQNNLVTIPVVVAPVTMRALKDLAIKWNKSELRLRHIDCRLGNNRVTLYLTFLATGRPTDTTRVDYKSLTSKSAQSRTYVTIIPMPVSSVRMDPPTAMLYGTQQQQLTATVLPDTATNKAIRWSSTNKKVATVSSTGLVTAIKPGVATIYATSVSGGKKAKCRITVMPFVPA
jgi:uncharacterized protein YjdB